MRFFPYLGFCLLLTSSLVAGCGDDGSGTAGAGGTGATGGTGGAGGMGGMGGTEPPPMCFEDDDCDFGEVCSTPMCNEGMCEYDPLPDNDICFGETGLSACLDGVCQPIWLSCEAEGAEDGDFCEPPVTPDPPQLGHCASGVCEVTPCEIAFDCWDGDLCTSDVCEDGVCSHPFAPAGTRCGVAFPMQCDGEGNCVAPPSE